jgi:hypothetical protein
LEKAFQISEDIPDDIQQLFGSIWEITAEKELISIDETPCSPVETGFPIRSNKLAGYSGEGGRQVFSAAFMKPSGFTNPSTVRRAVNRLLQLNILFESSGEYGFVIPFFRACIIYRG